MWSIRPEAFTAMREAAVREFRDRMVRALKQVFPDRTAAARDSDLERLADAAIERSDEVGFDIEYSIWVLYAAMFVFGERFDADPRHRHWAPDLLADDDFDENDKARLLGLRIYMATGAKV